jgi:hypothetical protein
MHLHYACDPASSVSSVPTYNFGFISLTLLQDISLSPNRFGDYVDIFHLTVSVLFIISHWFVAKLGTVSVVG